MLISKFYLICTFHNERLLVGASAVVIRGKKLKTGICKELCKRERFVHRCKYMCTYIYIYIYVCVCVCVCVCVYVNIKFIFL